MKAFIQLDVPEWQIGQNVTVYFPDTMVKHGKCEIQQEQEIVRCKDCEHRGNSEKCVLSAISKEKDFPLFMLDNRGEWFCADGERKDSE